MLLAVSDREDRLPHRYAFRLSLAQIFGTLSGPIDMILGWRSCSQLCIMCAVNVQYLGGKKQLEKLKKS